MTPPPEATPVEAAAPKPVAVKPPPKAAQRVADRGAGGAGYDIEHGDLRR